MEQTGCGKCVYESRNDAKKAANRIQGSRVYRCQECGYWHLCTARKNNHKKFRQQNRSHVTLKEIEKMLRALSHVNDLISISDEQDFHYRNINVPLDLSNEIFELVKRLTPKVERIQNQEKKQQNRSE